MNYTLENFIQYCDDMMIANEAMRIGNLPDELKLKYTSDNKIGKYEFAGALPCVNEVYVDSGNLDLSNPKIYNAIKDDYHKLINGINANLKREYWHLLRSLQNDINLANQK